MEKKRTRIVTKIGYVFCVEIDSLYKQYFQFVAIDLSQLGSSVIRVFKTKYPIDYKPVIEEIVQDEVWFYAHTVLRFGIQDGLSRIQGGVNRTVSRLVLHFHSHSLLWASPQQGSLLGCKVT